MTNFYHTNKDTINKSLTLILFTLSFYLFVRYLATFVAPMIIGYLIALTLRPLVLFFSNKLGLRTGPATVLSMITFLLLLGLLLFTAFSSLIRQGANFYYNLPAIIEMAEDIVLEITYSLNQFFDVVPDTFRQGLYGSTDVFVNATSSLFIEGIRDISTSIIGSAPLVIFTIIVGFISSYFFSRDMTLIRNTLGGLLPPDWRAKLGGIRTSLLHALGGYFKAQLKIMSVVSILGTIGLLIIGIPNPLFLGVIIALVDAIPVFGSGLIYWPWIIATIITGNYLQALGLIVLHIITLFTRQTLEPKLLGQQLGIHPILTLASIYIGLRLFGPLGIFLGLFFAVIFKTLLTQSRF